MDAYLDILDAYHYIVGEGPLWDEEKGLLYTVGFRENCIRIIDHENASIKQVNYPDLISCLVLTSDGNLLAATEKRICLLNLDGTYEILCDPNNFQGRRFNDGKIGPDGRFYIGSKDEAHHAALYRYSPDGSFTRLLDNVGTSNGLAWASNGKTLFFVDSPEKVIEAFDFDIDQGELSNRRVIINVPDNIGEFDGMTIDSEDMLWCAVWGAGKVYRINPYKGTVIDSISIPASQVSSCCFAGDDLKTLVITTSSYKKDLSVEPMAGYTFAIKVDVPGQKNNRFKM